MEKMNRSAVIWAAGNLSLAVGLVLVACAMAVPHWVEGVMRDHLNGNLMAVDTYHGLWKNCTVSFNRELTCQPFPFIFSMVDQNPETAHIVKTRLLLTFALLFAVAAIVGQGAGHLRHQMEGMLASAISCLFAALFVFVASGIYVKYVQDANRKSTESFHDETFNPIPQNAKTGSCLNMGLVGGIFFCMSSVFALLHVYLPKNPMYKMLQQDLGVPVSI
ncbi:uncharacterized protein LOC143463023 isoform X2 [Clavelina lepadiformis]|uniref:uncharacterized protein LOC143463023 isoform X2 n=1 Tax=Clavelina lepadiformis TaxID=159417 RepID=UPI0040419EB9